MDLQPAAIAAIKTQFAMQGRWEAISVTEHVETSEGLPTVPPVPPSTKRHVSVTVAEVNTETDEATGRVLVFQLEGGAEITHGALMWGGCTFEFDDPELIAWLMGALAPEREAVFHAELLSFLTGEGA
jgi:hypothetical protein